MKKVLIALFLIFTLALSGCGGAKPARIALFTPSAGSAIVLSVFAFNANSERIFGTVNMGHAFIAVQNNGQAPVRVGAITLEKGESCTVGAWGMSAYFGLWYNVESEYMSQYGRYKGRVSLSMEVTPEELAAVNEVIKNNDTWTFSKNCSAFALAAWNACGKNVLALSGIVTPQSLLKELRRFNTFKTDEAVSDFGKVGHLRNGAFEQYELVR